MAPAAGRGAGGKGPGPLRTVVVDDEAPSRARLRRLLEDRSDVDYLLKPVDAERLEAALGRVRERRRRSRKESGREQLESLLQEVRRRPEHLDRLCVKHRGKVELIEAEDVAWIDGARNYVRLHVDEREYQLRHTLGGLADRLDPERFVRIHRSTIVNMDFVTEVSSSASGDCTVHLLGGHRLSVSRTYRKALDRFLENR